MIKHNNTTLHKNQPTMRVKRHRYFMIAYNKRADPEIYNREKKMYLVIKENPIH